MTNKSHNIDIEADVTIDTVDIDALKRSLPGFSRFTFRRQKRDTQADILERLGLLLDEFNKRRNEEIFKPEFVTYNNQTSSMLRLLIDIKDDSIYSILGLLFEEIRKAKKNKNEEGYQKYIDAAKCFVGISEGLDFRPDFMDLNDTIFYDNFVSGMSGINETLNWQYTRVRAYCIYGLVLGEEYDPVGGIETLKIFANYLNKLQPPISDKNSTNKIKEQIDGFIQNLDDLDEIWLTRMGIHFQDVATRKGIACLAGVAPETVVNASMKGEIEAIIPEKGEKKHLKNNWFEAESAEKWLTNKKRRKRYFKTIEDSEGHDTLVLSIYNIEELQQFLTENQVD